MKRIIDAEAELQNLLRAVPARTAFIHCIDQLWLKPAASHDIAIAVFAQSAESCESKPAALRLVLTDNIDKARSCDTNLSLEQIAEHLETAVFDLSKPLSLLPVCIPKPWGQEIWFTGVEARGVCSFGQGAGVIPIPWLLQTCGSLLYGKAESTLVLLKILDPLPEEVFGDLYVELHEKKQEVYVVTHIDENAWPNGIGSIRFGFNQQKRHEYADDASFRAAYLQAVRDYRAVRVEIDALLDGMRQTQDIALDAAVSAAQQKIWLAKISPQLQSREKALREQMDGFYGYLPLQLGDVIKVPCHVPHSLQHGVRTVEFQTPVYERKILSFAQKVLTQAHWDTEQALSLCEVAPVRAEELEPLPPAEGATIERIVDFDTFEVFRVSLTQGASFDLKALTNNRDYAEVMTVSGSAMINERDLTASTALLIPSGCSNWTVSTAAANTVVVVACPKERLVC